MILVKFFNMCMYREERGDIMEYERAPFVFYKRERMGERGNGVGTGLEFDYSKGCELTDDGEEEGENT